ncbi:MAG: hypothetical protein ACYSSP_12425 [Planctomycetota bacterium]|jgi:hypothetical protein
MSIEISKNYNAYTFEADLKGIHELQASFVASAPEFLYLRKGEHSGARRIAAFYGLCRDYDYEKIKEPKINQDFELFTANLKTEPWFFEVDRTKACEIRDYRIISIEDDNTIQAKQLYNELGVKVIFIPIEEKHLYRFYLSDKKYAFFIRHGEDENAKFCGHIGEDESMIKNLKKQFLELWDKHSTR